jgi:hypothetical protein
MAEFFQLSTAERLDALNAAANTSGLLPHLLGKRRLGGLVAAKPLCRPLRGALGIQGRDVVVESLRHHPPFLRRRGCAVTAQESCMT